MSFYLMIKQNIIIKRLNLRLLLILYGTDIDDHNDDGGDNEPLLRFHYP